MVTVPDAAGHLVFVSHSGEDTWVAQQIARCIGECGAQPLLDQADVPVGAEFEEDVRDFLERADELVVHFTPWSLERPYVWAEIGAAWIRRIPIIVLLLGTECHRVPVATPCTGVPQEEEHHQPERGRCLSG